MADAYDPPPALRGKQLVFLFMATTGAAVVVFLTGVMVGRGVRLQTAGMVTSDSFADPTLDPAPPLAAPTGTTAQGPSPAARESLTYPEQLSELNPPAVLAEPAVDPTAEITGGAAPPRTPATERAAAAPAAPAAPAPSKAVASPPPAAPDPAPRASRSPAASGSDAGTGYAVQVAAVRDRAEADRIADRLKGKGYAAYITSPAPGMFRVRVGRFEQLRQAETVAARLEKDEQFKPWITK